jgi:phage terminase Nu1 subunit (DNA packaging protein)
MSENVVNLQSAPELYLTRKQLAEKLNIGLSTVDKFVRLGMPSQTWGIRTRRFRLSECERWLRERERMAA